MRSFGLVVQQLLHSVLAVEIFLAQPVLTILTLPECKYTGLTALHMPVIAAKLILQPLPVLIAPCRPVMCWP